MLRALKKWRETKRESEIGQAIRELTYKERQFMFATAEFEPVAYHELKAAQARVDALIKEIKEGRAHETQGSYKPIRKFERFLGQGR